MSSETEPAESAIRETYSEYAMGEKTVATITDPENGSAWIQSDVVEEVRP